MGKAAQRRQPEWEKTVAAVRKRATTSFGYARCDCCGGAFAPELLDPHHCFGRRNQVPRKYADMPELVAAACRACHDEVTNHPRCDKAHTLQLHAAYRFAHSHGFNYHLSFVPGFTPLQAVRAMVREIEARQEAA